jgi:signal transduction histidine kinase
VDLEIVGERRSLGAGVELAAYRTVQHALAAVNGTDRQPATVQLRYLSGALELEVRGFPPDGSAAAAALLAARERVMAHGGTFSTDSPASGQRVLRARLAVVATDG